jgi:hypothetical protein
VQFGDAVEGDLRPLHFPRSKLLRFFVAHQCPVRHDLGRILAAEFLAEREESLAEPLHHGKGKQRLAAIPRNIKTLGSGIEVAAHEPRDVGLNRCTHASRVSVRFKAHPDNVNFATGVDDNGRIIALDPSHRHCSIDIHIDGLLIALVCAFDPISHWASPSC